jgi:hypothetical protein
MSELAFNINGEAFEVPANATGWRVRKMRAKGSPEVVYAREGQPLVLPISAEIDDLRAEVDTTGRYRLDLVDQDNKAITGAPSGYVQINFEVEVNSDAQSTSVISLGKPSDNVVIEAMRMNSEIAKSVIDRFPLMLEAAATLLRAADGAGLPARPPRAIEDGEDGDDDDDDDGDASEASSPGMDFLNSLVAQIVPLVVTSMAGKKMPKLGAILDWRKAAPQAAQAPADATPAAEPKPSATDALPPLDPKVMSHFIAIQTALTPHEATLARQLGAELSPAELRGWIEELSVLSVPDAVAKVRSIVGKSSNAGGAS